MSFELSKELRGFQYEVEDQTNPIVSIRYKCQKCGRFKKNNTNSKYCFRCL
jgi:hypothetical protein